MINVNSRPSKTHSSLEKTRTQLRTLSNRDLLSNLERLNGRERKLRALVLLYLSVIDTRELYLPMGYSSLFDFCTMHLKYTRATAGRRIRAARAVAQYPEALDMLRSGEINITTLSMISDILDRENHAELLDSIKHKSTRHVEMLVSSHRPVPAIRDTVRPVCVRRRVESGAGSSAVGTAPADLDGSGAPAAGSSAGTGGQNPSSTVDTGSRKSNKISLSAETNSGCPDATSGAESNPAPKTRVFLEQRLKLGFSVSPEFMIKLNKIKSLLSNKHPEGIDFETLFEHLMDEYLERHDPVKKRARRKRRAAARDAAGQKPEKRSPHKAKTTKGSDAERGNPRGTGRESDAARKNRHGRGRAPDQRSRRIPPAVRDRVYARDKGRCSFVGANGKRCDATWDLEIDHIIPYARGGNNSPGNLRLLCRKHNIHHAERAYGREFMKDRMNM